MRKYLIILLIVIMLIISGCDEGRINQSPQRVKDRFTLEKLGDSFVIITDKETGVQYLSYSNGLTKLE